MWTKSILPLSRQKKNFMIHPWNECINPVMRCLNHDWKCKYVVLTHHNHLNHWCLRVGHLVSSFTLQLRISSSAKMECGLSDQDILAKDSIPLAHLILLGAVHCILSVMTWVTKGLAWAFPCSISWLEWVDHPILGFGLALSTIKLSHITLKGSATIFFFHFLGLWRPHDWTEYHWSKSLSLS